MGSNEKRRRMLRRQAIIVAIVAAAVLYVAANYSRWQAATNLINVRFESPDGRVLGKFRLEVANDRASVRKGLMFRKPGEVPEDGGMLFVFPDERIQYFYMKNTYIPLDMIFLNRDLKVVGVLHDVPINNTQKRSVNKPSQYVVELLAGTARKFDIKEGARLVVENGSVPAARMP
ncbi:MAG: DUF192 domain-containing protein [Candidatus Dadabacteria bacterium]|nr:MAG: DUF192 domain-containing protein [Candidatus Dadabacteria bacterium]